MTEARPDLDAECRVFTRYLVRLEADDYIATKYREAHRRLDLEVEPGSFEERLLRRAALGPRRTRLADAYSRIFLPRSALRRKLVLLLAILESRAPFCREIDRVPAPTVPLVWIGLAAQGCLAACSLLLGALWLGPGHRRHPNRHGGA